jgi:CubicO group peptidase (beta-lactamase class C family)
MLHNVRKSDNTVNMKRVILAAVSLTVLTAPHATLAQALPDRIASVVEAAGIGGSVMVCVAGEVVFASGYGMANREHSVPNSPQTKFRIGSITKQFTAMGIMILRDRGALDASDAVGDHVGPLPETCRGLTLHQRLTHTSGIMHSWALPGFSATMAVPTTLDATLQRFFDQPLLFEPGSDFAYSGVGYFLLAKVIEEVSDIPYAEFLSREIFVPLGEADSGADTQEAVIDRRASGYERGEDGTVRNAPDIYMPLLTGGGNLYSTVGDLTKWDRALTAGRLLSVEGYEALYRPELNNYAYGWQVGETRDGIKRLSHSGGVPGFAALNVRVPSMQVDIVVLTNLTPGQLWSVANQIVAIVLEDAGAGSGSF